jgi:hypothetical protein
VRDETDIGGRAGRFPTTRRSTVLAAGSDDASEKERAFGLLVAAYWFTPAARPMILGIVVGSTFKGLIAGVLIGWFAKKVGSLPLGILFGVAVGLVLAYAVAAMPSATGEHYYFQIMLPGAIVGAIAAYATQKHGGVRTAPA